MRYQITGVMLNIGFALVVGVASLASIFTGK